MNADELDAAREAVSATRTWRDQMRADWGTSFREPEEVLDEAVGELLAERDRLRAVVDADDLDRFIREQGPEFAALVKIQIVEAENARLRAVAAAADALLTSDRESWSPEHEALAAALSNAPALDVDVRAERDRLRAVVEAARRFADAATALRAHTEENADHAALYGTWTEREDELVAAIQQLDVSPAMGRHVTATGEVLTDADIQALADEAEQGYDVSHLSPQTPEQIAEVRARRASGTSDTGSFEMTEGQRRTIAEAVDPTSPTYDPDQYGTVVGSMTPAEAYELYANPVNREPQGPPVRRRESIGEVGPELGDDEAIVIHGVPYRVGTLRKLTEDGTVPVVTLYAIGTPDTSEPPPLREVCADCDGRGCETCDGMGWRINPDYFGPVRDCE